MNNFIRIDRRIHGSFLADHCIDPTTKEMISVGDEVCICANCKIVHFKSVWISVKVCPSCNQEKKTLSKIPHSESPTEQLNKKKGVSFWGVLYFLFPLVGFIMFFVYKSRGQKKKQKQAITISIIAIVLSIIVNLSENL